MPSDTASTEPLISIDETGIRPLEFTVPPGEFDDLRRRIAATRWPEQETVGDRSQGVPLATIRELARYWTNGYDFGRLQATLDALPQFVTEIDGLDIHFIHVRSNHDGALPLVVTHGWPGSVIEQLKIIEPLTDPTAHGADAVGRLRHRHPVVARVRILGETDHDRLGPDPHRERLDRADGAPRVHAVRRAGR